MNPDWRAECQGCDFEADGDTFGEVYNAAREHMEETGHAVDGRAEF